MAVIAIDLGGTKALGAVFDASGKMCARQVKLLDGAKGDAVGDIVLGLIKAPVSYTHLTLPTIA